MTEQSIQKIEEALGLVQNKESKIFFLTQDTKGTPKASITYIYEMVKTLNNLGYKAFILHEKNDYKLQGDAQGMGISDWLGEEYVELPHASVESGELTVGPADVLIVPELFGHVMEQTKDMTCTKIVLCQSYDYIFEMLPPGMDWMSYGYTKCITTSDEAHNYVKSIFPNIETYVIPVGISERFTKSDLPGKPIVGIHTREPRDTAKIIKTFYAKFPQFKWVTFRDMRGMSLEEMSNAMKELAAAVWVDDISGFGTFPVEAMKSGVPVIAKIPNLKPNWLEEENGFWTYEFNQIPDVVNAFMKTWLEDSVPVQLLSKMDEVVERYTLEQQNSETEAVFEQLFKEKETELTNAINRFTETENN